MSDSAIPESMIRQRIDRMETAPVIGALMLMLLLLLCLAAVLYVRVALRDRSSGAAEFMVQLLPVYLVFPALLIAGLVWWRCMVSFRDSCQGQRGWRRTWWGYQAAALLPMLPVGAGVAVFAITGEVFGCAIVLFVTGAVLIVVCGVFARQRLRTRVLPMQREMAVLRARMRLERRCVENRAGSTGKDFKRDERRAEAGRTPDIADSASPCRPVLSAVRVQPARVVG